MAGVNEYMDILGRKMGPREPETTYDLMDAVKDQAVKAPTVENTPVILKPTKAAAPAVKPGWSEPTYSSKNQSALDRALTILKNRKPFEYDPETAPLYQGYKKQYTREGARAAEDTIGKVAGRTGGLPSSYATSAAQQQQNYYMQLLADKIPSLRQQRYQEWRDELGDLRADVSLYTDLEDRDRRRFEADRSFGRDVFENDRDFDLRKSESDYQKEQDAKKWAWDEAGRAHDWEQEEKSWNWKERQAAIEEGQYLYETTGRADALGKAMGLEPEDTQALIDVYAEKKDLEKAEAARQLADWYATHGDLSKLGEIIGDTSLDKALIDAQKRQAALTGVRSSGSGRGSGGSKGSQSDGLLQNLMDAEDEAEAELILLGAGVSQWQFNKYMEQYRAAKEKSTGPMLEHYTPISYPQMPTKNFDNLKTQVGTKLLGGRVDEAADIVRNYESQLSLSQREALMDMIERLEG